MFRIESYLTPILMNYMTKYVRDIRPQDFQMSLWEGEVTFQNLELRLSVLENEFNLPFEIVSGHIHELNILVPWTKIISEPIRIKINTIEFILKAREQKPEGYAAKPENMDEAPTSSTCAKAKSDSSATKSRLDERSTVTSKQEQKSVCMSTRSDGNVDGLSTGNATSPSGGLGSAFLAKIVANINVNCENIILKYVDDEVVISMNIQLFNMGAANEEWKVAMVDVQPLHVVIRKLITVSDLTMCVDKRNSAGQIEACMEPIIYRCNMECRMLRSYTVGTADKVSKTRIGIFTKFLEMNLASLQLPLLMRLVKSLGKQTSEMENVNKSKSETPHVSINETTPLDESVRRQSIFAWVWKYITKLTTTNAESSATSAQVEGHIKEFGVYIEELNFTLKNSEFVNDAIVGGIKRVIYSPIVRIGLGGIYVEKTDVKEIDWESFRIGISSICVEPLADFRSDAPGDSNVFIETESFRSMRSFIDKSLFDHQCQIENKCSTLTNYKEYNAIMTDDYLTYRSPVFAFDALQYRSLAERVTFSSDKGFQHFDGERRNFSETEKYLYYAEKDADEMSNDGNVLTDVRKQIRLLSGGVTFRFNETFIQVKNVIQKIVDLYNYTPYSNAEKSGAMDTSAGQDTKVLITQPTPTNAANPSSINVASSTSPKLPPPVVEDYERLLRGVPLCSYKMQIKNVNVQVFPKYKRSGLLIEPILKGPFFNVHLGLLTATLSLPMDADKLVHTVCQLADKPSILLKECYQKVKLNFTDIIGQLIIPDIDCKFDFIKVPQIDIKYEKILQQHHWKKSNVSLDNFDGICKKIIIEHNSCHLLAIRSLLESLLYSKELSIKLLNDFLLCNNTNQPNQSKTISSMLKTTFSEINLVYCKLHTYSIYNFSIKTLNADIETIKNGQLLDTYNLINTPNAVTSANKLKCFECQIQLPTNNYLKWKKPLKPNTVVSIGLWIGKFNIIVDKRLVEYLTLTKKFGLPKIDEYKEVFIRKENLQQKSFENVALPTSLRVHMPNLIRPQKSSFGEVTYIGGEHEKFSEQGNNEQIGNGLGKPRKTVYNISDDILWKYSYFNSFIINIEVAACKLYLAEKRIRNEHNEISGLYTEVTLPKITWRSTYADQIVRSNIQKKVTTPAGTKNFNWTILLEDFSVKVHDQDKYYELLKPWQCNITVILIRRNKRENAQNYQLEPYKTNRNKTENKAEKSAHLMDIKSNKSTTQMVIHESGLEVYALNVYIQSSILSLYCKKIEPIYGDIYQLTVIKELWKNKGVIMSENNSWTSFEESVKILTMSEEDVALKDFMDMDTNSEALTSMQDNFDFNYKSELAMSIFCQWILAKIIVEFEACTSEKSNKIALELEDLLFTADQNIEYRKYTGKIGNLKLKHLMRNDLFTKWTIQQDFSIGKVSDSTDRPFLNLTLTDVSLKDFYQRIGVKKRFYGNKTIMELIIILNSLEVILDLDRVPEIIEPFCVFCDIYVYQMRNYFKNQFESDIDTQSSWNHPKFLPLIHFENRGITCYLSLSQIKDFNSVLIWTIGEINVTSNLKNPLQRNPLRPDVFAKATSMGMLTVPGAMIEDRQYEITFKNISAASANWFDVLKTKSSFIHLNPAVEWNNPEKKPKDLVLHKIFQNFELIVIYAPAIIYNNVLICGAALEFNCAVDLIAKIATDQLIMLTCHVRRVTEIMSIVDGYRLHITKLCRKNNGHKADLSRINVSTVSFATKQDSLIEFKSAYSNILESESETFHEFSVSSSNESDIPVYRSKYNSTLLSFPMEFNHSSSNIMFTSSPIPHRSKPISISFVAGVFIINIYEFTNEDRTSKETLLAANISQPSFIFTQNIFDYTLQYSLFSITLYLSCLEGKDCSKKNTSNNTNIVILDTKRGELDASGVPASLFSYKLTYTRQKQREIELKFGKPLVLNLSEKTAIQFFNNSIRIWEALQKSYTVNTYRSSLIIKRSKIKQLKAYTLEADRLSISMHTFALKFNDPVEYACKLVISDIRINIKYQTLPEKCSANCTLGAAYMSVLKHIVIHPIALNSTLDITKEQWQNVPSINGSIRVNVIQLDMGIHAIITLRQVYNTCYELYSLFSKELNKCLQRIRNLNFMNYIQYSMENLRMLRASYIQNESSRRMHEPKEEYYYDDLRAGAFQYLEVDTDAILPHAYQIQIIKKDYGIICWRYPQPRSIALLSINAIPMEEKNKSLQITCRMEYFSDVHDGFLPYCDFSLSESKTNNIELPSRCVWSNTWRVIILQPLVMVNRECFDGTDDDVDLLSVKSIVMDESHNDTLEQKDFVLHPRVLVGCMRVDTIFRVDTIPQIQLLIHCNQFLLKFQNKAENNFHLPSLLKRFRLAAKSTRVQSFCNVLLTNTNIYGIYFHENRFSIESSLTAKITCLDFGFFNMLNLLEDTNFNFYFEVNDITRDVIANITFDKLNFNIGPAILHGLIASKNHWEELLDKDELRIHYFLVPRCIVANRTKTTIGFGQTGTQECIKLNSKECCLYTFCSDYYKQELTIFTFIDGKDTPIEYSESVHIQFQFEEPNRYSYLRIGNRYMILKSRKLSSSQILLLVKGQIELFSMLSHNLTCEFRYYEKEDIKLIEKHFEKYAKETLYIPLNKNSKLLMRLKINDEKNATGFTGDIPLHMNKHLPWLVKVPIGTNEYFTCWVRILRESLPILEDSDNPPQRMLISIWPIFEVTSMLTSPITFSEIGKDIDIRLQGVGGKYTMEVPATHLTNHILKFSYPFPTTQTSCTKYDLSLKSMDWNEFFWYDDSKWNVEEAVNALGKPNPRYWPYKNDNELRIDRHSMSKSIADVKCSVKPSREFSCTLNLNIMAWGYFINSTDIRIRIRQFSDIEAQRAIIINSNELEMLINLRDGFIIDIPNGPTWKESIPIFFIRPKQNAPKHYHCLTEATPCTLWMAINDKIYCFVLTSFDENNHIVLKLSTKFVVVNFTPMRLCFLPFALSKTECVDRTLIEALDNEHHKFEVRGSSQVNNCVGISMGQFYDVNAKTCRRDENTIFVYYVCLKLCVTGSLSQPIPLQSVFKRRCISVIQRNGDPVPLALMLMEHENIFYLSIMRDQCPAIHIINETSCDFVIAETPAVEGSAVLTTTSNYDQGNIDWHHTILQQNESYFTPPTRYMNYPNIETTSLTHVTLALCQSENAKGKSLKWSKSMCVDKSHKKYLHIPGHGDVQVVICDRHRTIQFYIRYVSQVMEFSASEIRKRLILDDDDGLSRARFSVATPITRSSATFAYINSRATSICKSENRSVCYHIQNNDSFLTRRNSSWYTGLFDATFKQKIHCYIKQFKFSVHTDSKQLQYMKSEALSMYMDDVLIAYRTTPYQSNDNDDDNVSEEERQLTILIPNLQIDNQLFSTGNYDFPVIICGQSTYSINAKKMPSINNLEMLCKCMETKEIPPIIQIKVQFYCDEYKIRSINCQFNNIRAYIEDAFITNLIDVLDDCNPTNCVYRPKQEYERRILEAGQILIPQDVVDMSTMYLMEPLQIREFSIEPMNVMLSVHTSVHLYLALDHSPLSFSAYRRENLVTMPWKLGQSLGMHYLSGAIFGAGWVVGSLEILGSPGGFARSITTGLKDFISMPVRGLFRGPWGFVMGVTHGSASLLMNLTAGTVNSVTKLASSVARNLDRLTLDSEHIERTELIRRHRPQGFAEGFCSGLTSFGISLLGAVGGLAHHTLEARSASEVLTGVGKGIVGAVAKPISGAAELVALAGQGMLQTVGFNTLPRQREPSVCRNLASHASAYRFWRLLPAQLISDQILFYYKVTILVKKQLMGGYVLLTSTLFAIIQADWDKLLMALPIDKVELVVDSKDNTLYYVLLKREKDPEEELRVNNDERILNFLQSSAIKITSDSLADLLQAQDVLHDSMLSELEYAFYINCFFGRHMATYLKVLNAHHAGH